MATKPKEGEGSDGCHLGAEGSGVIVNASNQDLIGKKVAFTYGAWCNYVVRDLSEIIIFDDPKLDERMLVRAYVNPMTALCLQQRLRDIVVAGNKGPGPLSCSFLLTPPLEKSS